MAQSCTAPGPLGHLPAVAPASGAARRRWWRRGRGMRSHIVAEKVIRYHGVISKAKQINEQNRRQALWRRACGDMKPQRQGVETAGSRSQATRRVVQHPSCRGQAAHRDAGSSSTGQAPLNTSRARMDLAARTASWRRPVKWERQGRRPLSDAAACACPLQNVLSACPQPPAPSPRPHLLGRPPPLARLPKAWSQGWPSMPSN